MKRSILLFTVLFTLMLPILVGAESLNVRVLLPDKNGAPFATVTVGDSVFTADENGEVQISFKSEKTALVRWLDLEAEIAIQEEMKFTNRLYYGAPYDKYDFVLWGPDLWEVTETSLTAPGGLGSESQLFLDDAFDNIVVRSRFTAEATGQWYYLRFNLRSFEPGFNGYTFSSALHVADESSFERVHGNWDKWDQITENHYVYSAFPANQNHEFVAFLKDNHIVIYVREESHTQYTKVVDVIDDSEKAFEYGGVGILNSFTDCTVTEFSVFRY